MNFCFCLRVLKTCFSYKVDYLGIRNAQEHLLTPSVLGDKDHQSLEVAH